MHKQTGKKTLGKIIRNFYYIIMLYPAVPYNKGPIQRIVVPKFDFSQAEKEERYVEEVMDAQMIA